MEYAVYDDTQQLVVVRLAEELGVRAYGVERDDEVAVDDIAVGVVEGDDVGVVVVAEILAVHLENLLVVAEEIAYLSHSSAVRGCNLPDPSAHVASAYGRHLHVFGVVCYH